MGYSTTHGQHDVVFCEAKKRTEMLTMTQPTQCMPMPQGRGTGTIRGFEPVETEL